MFDLMSEVAERMATIKGSYFFRHSRRITVLRRLRGNFVVHR